MLVVTAYLCYLQAVNLPFTYNDQRTRNIQIVQEEKKKKFKATNDISCYKYIINYYDFYS